MRLKTTLAYGIRSKIKMENFSDLELLLDIPKNEPDMVILPEYLFDVEEVMENRERILEFADRNDCEILMAPGGLIKRKRWEIRRRELKEAGIEVGDSKLDDEDKPSSVGFWFNGERPYAFPKSWEKKPVHKIPGREVGVTICGEINHIKEEDLEGIELLLNPSAEGDDIYVKGRTLDEAGASKDEIFKEYSWLKEEKVEKGINKEPFYVEDLSQILEEKGVPVVRCDDEESSGVLYKPKDLEIIDYEFNEDYSHLSLNVDSF